MALPLLTIVYIMFDRGGGGGGTPILTFVGLSELRGQLVDRARYIYTARPIFRDGSAHIHVCRGVWCAYLPH